MVHFFERLEREIDFTKEYKKLERMVSVEGYSEYPSSDKSLNRWIEDHFRKWKYRQNYTSFAELREQLDFGIHYNYGIVFFSRNYADMNDYFLFGEMVLNLIYGIESVGAIYTDNPEKIDHFIATLKYNVEKCGFKIELVDDKYKIVKENAVAVEVADSVPELADAIIEYNHYILKGNIARKQELLKKIADALEPKRKELNSLNYKREADDFFWMVNKMNVRHNNCDSSDLKKYVKQFADLSSQEKEEWYDLIYEQALALFVLLGQKERSQTIQSFKTIVES